MDNGYFIQIDVIKVGKSGVADMDTKVSEVIQESPNTIDAIDFDKLVKETIKAVDFKAHVNEARANFEIVKANIAADAETEAN